MNWVFKKHYSYLLFGILYFMFWFLFKFGGWAEFPRALYSSIIDIVVTMSCLLVTVEILLPKFIYHQKYSRFILSFILLVLFAGSVIILSQMKLLGQSLLSYRENLAKHPEHYFYWFWADLIFGSYFMVFFISLTGAGVRLAFDKLKESAKVQRLESEKITAELQLLKEQINPHFLFNALNTIYYKIDRNNAAARDILQRFSGMLRYQLYECNNPWVDIKSEFAFIKSYIELQKERLNENYKVSYQGFNEATGFEIAPFLLLPLVENCFKHVSDSAEKENTITLTCSQSGNTFQFETINTINPGYQKSENGIGLENIRKRLQLLYAGRHELNVCQAEDSFTVNLKIDNRVTEKA